jgi:hypothetical protein
MNSGRAATNSKSKSVMYHLYLTSDAVIKEKDYIITGGLLAQVVMDHGVLTYQSGPAMLYLTERCKKVVATTDPNLGLPKIPVSFAKSYVEAQGIPEVLVDYIEFMEGDGDFMSIIEHDGTHCSAHRNNFPMLAIRKNNTVIISKAKTYSREEVKQIGLNFLKTLSLGDNKVYNNYEQKWLKHVDEKL